MKNVYSVFNKDSEIIPIFVARYLFSLIFLYRLECFDIVVFEASVTVFVLGGCAQA